METCVINLAGVSFSIEGNYPLLMDFVKDYYTQQSPEKNIIITQQDIDFERQKSRREFMIEGCEEIKYSKAYLETLAAYRKLSDALLDYDTILFHGSVIAIDGVAYLFTAKSGTGKSTHTRLWREYFGDRAVMINDDKPLLKITDDGVVAYGTPWNGKHKLGENTSAPLKAICILERDETNHIEKITKKDAYNMLVQQTHKATDASKLVKSLQLIDALASKVELYRLGCNMDKEAAIVSFEGMNKI